MRLLLLATISVTISGCDLWKSQSAKSGPLSEVTAVTCADRTSQKMATVILDTEEETQQVVAIQIVATHNGTDLSQSRRDYLPQTFDLKTSHPNAPTFEARFKDGSLMEISERTLNIIQGEKKYSFKDCFTNLRKIGRYKSTIESTNTTML